MIEYVPKRGDLIYVDFDPQTGHEQRGRRPAIVLTPYEYNRKTSLALVCPITSKVKGYPFEIKLPSHTKIQGVVLTDHLRNLDWRARNATFIEHSGDTITKHISQIILALLDQ